MCYSAMVKEDLRRAERAFGASIDWQDFLRLLKQREREWTLKIPDGLVQSLIEYDAPESRTIQEYANRFRVFERRRAEEEIQVVRNEIEVLESLLQKKLTKTTQAKLDVKTRKLQKLQQGSDVPSVASAGGYRIYPKYFAPVVMQRGDRRIIVPMRFRVLPAHGVEIPTLYNVFNARRESLQSVKTWKPLFGYKHAIFPFERFFEWVDQEGTRVEIAFNPNGYDEMWAASVYEEYQHPELGLIRSFAMVTDDPPTEVKAAGHDRCPVFLEESLISKWLAPEGQTLAQLDALLDHKQRTYYGHALAA